MDISGRWYNELNSTMDIEIRGKMISGSYVSAVGDAKGPYDLIGFTDDARFPVVGWIVAWQNDQKSVPAITVWAGQGQVVEIEGGPQDQITTMWLLSRSTSVQEDWESMMIGEDIFRRRPFSREQVREAMKRRGVRKVRSPAPEK